MRGRSPRNSRDRRLVRVVIVAGFVIVLGLFLPSLFAFLGSVALAPIHGVSNWVNESSSLIPAMIRDRRTLLTEIEQLESALAVAERSDATQQRLFEENQRLRRVLNVDAGERVAAVVTARPDELPYDFLRLDRGREDGVEVGAPVYIGADAVVGLVTHATAQYSFVELFTTPGFRATVFVSGPDVVARMEGMGGGVARVSLPQGIPLTRGNLVYLPSIDPGVFGRVSYVENEPTQPEQYGYITPNISTHSIHTVAVGRARNIDQSVDAVEAQITDYLSRDLEIEGIGVDVLTGTTSTSSATSTTATATPTES